MTSLKRRLRPSALLWLFFAMLSANAAHAFEIQSVESNSGIEAWLVEDYTNPIVTMAASFSGGAAQDPAGKEGLATLISSLFDEGAGPYDAKAFQALLETNGIQLRYDDRRDRFTLVLRTLRSDRDTAFEMLRLSLTELRFEPDSIERMRSALKARILRSENRPSTKAGQALRSSLFGNHPYARSTDGTIDGLDAITRDDIVDHFSRLFARDNLTIGLVGAIGPEEARAMLDRVFSGLPATAGLDPIPEVTPRFGEIIRIEEASPQTTISLALPGVSRQSERFFAAYLMNHILGGGSFTSRLYEAVRERRGLAYSIHSNLTNYDHAAFLSLGTATRADQSDEALAVIREEIRAMAENGPTEAELEAAKRYVIGAYAIDNLDTSSNIARALVAMQEESLGIDYIEKREAQIEAVTVEDVRAVARELLATEPTVVVVGPAKS